MLVITHSLRLRRLSAFPGFLWPGFRWSCILRYAELLHLPLLLLQCHRIWTFGFVVTIDRSIDVRLRTAFGMYNILQYLSFEI